MTSISPVHVEWLFLLKQINMDITWLPKQDNFVEGSIGDITFYIKLKKVGIFTLQALSIELKEGEREKEIVDSLYILDKNREERTGPEKVMAHEHEAYTVEEMKIIANLLYHNSLSPKD